MDTPTPRGKVNSFRDLIVWQKAKRLAADVYRLCLSFPSDRHRGLTEQMLRSAVSIPSNIAEGYGRNTDKSFSYFLDIARGSLFEIETQLVISNELGFITNEKIYRELLNQIEEESKMINAFSKKLKS